MANNKHLRTLKSTLLLNKVDEMSRKLKDASQSGSGQTKQDLVTEATTFLSEFFHRLGKPIFNPPIVIPGQIPDLAVYNKNIDNLISDLRVIFIELQRVAEIAVANFNFTLSTTNRLTSKLKNIFSKVEDYTLFTNDPNKDSIYFSDSFNNLDRVDFNSKLINSSQCEIDQAQGIALLPVDQSALQSINITKVPTINNSSNGTSGNNFEAGRATNNDLMLMFDNNADTWFEYERVTSKSNDTREALILDFIVNLDIVTSINYIRINPNNFGIKSPIVIETIETSEDGNTYDNIKDDIPEGNFLLAPSTSKFFGQGVYSFTPRKAKYVHLILRQSAPYSIVDKTNGSSKLRYAIGIRDIEIAGIPYINEGEVISTEYQLDEVVKKVALVTHQFPEKDSELNTIRHYVSVDNGSSWHAIKSKDSLSEDDNSPIILSFNTSDSDTITTQVPVKSLRYKAVLKRNTAAFSNFSSLFTRATQSATELHEIPDESPFEIELNEIPTPDSLVILDPLYGSRGFRDSRFRIATGTNSALIVNLPFKNIKKELAKEDFGDPLYKLVEVDPEEIRINGELWTRSVLATSSSTDKVYELDYNAGIIKFGNNAQGKAVPANAEVNIQFTEERLFPSSDIEHKSNLNFPTTNDSESFVIKSYKASQPFTDTLVKGNNIHLLSHPVLDIAGTFSSSDSAVITLGSKVTYIDGDSELTLPGQWSLDAINGILYTYSETNVNTVTTFSYLYEPVKTLTTNDSSFGISKGLQTEISIHDSGWETNNVVNQLLPDTRRYVALPHLAIVKGSVSFSEPTVFKQEVDFIDGNTELSSSIRTSEKILPSSLTLFTPPFIYSFPLNLPSTSGLNVTFSNRTIFNTIALTPAAPGEWVAVGNTIRVYLIDVPDDLGTINYSYVDTTKNLTGQYSINYKTGEIFTASSILLGTKVNYQYTDYRASYHIARQIDSKDYTLDISSNTVTINPREVLQRKRLTNDSGNTLYHFVFDKVSENRDNILDIEPYFTPMLRDYALKVITESDSNF